MPREVTEGSVSFMLRSTLHRQPAGVELAANSPTQQEAAGAALNA
jgi:hypothetical protein